MPTELPIYLDAHATTPLDERVLEAMLPWMQGGPRGDFGNPSSAGHVYGWRAEAAVEKAREKVALAIGAEPREIVFTSGATESDNLAILGTAEANPQGRIVSVVTEHPAVLDCLDHVESQGTAICRLGVDGHGRLDLRELAAALVDPVSLVSVMWANSEIGLVPNMDEIASLCGDRGVALHSDAAQAVGKVPVDVTTTPVSMLSISGHKIYGPKGVGALYVRRRRPRTRLAPRQFGGGQEGGLRSGTVPVHQVVGLACAIDLAVAERPEEAVRVGGLRDRLWEKLSLEIDDVTRNGDPAATLPGNLNVCFKGVDGDKLLLALHDIALSTGSACSSASPEPSHVLRAIGCSDDDARSSVRFGLGRFTREDEIDRAAVRVIEEVRKLRV